MIISCPVCYAIDRLNDFKMVTCPVWGGHRTSRNIPLSQADMELLIFLFICFRLCAARPDNAGILSGRTGASRTVAVILDLNVGRRQSCWGT